jgi:hypothetical protein
MLKKMLVLSSCLGTLVFSGCQNLQRSSTEQWKQTEKTSEEYSIDPALLRVLDDPSPDPRSREYDCLPTESGLPCVNYDVGHGGAPDTEVQRVPNRLRGQWIRDVGQLDAFYSLQLGIEFEGGHQFKVDWSQHVLFAVADTFEVASGKSIRILTIERDEESLKIALARKTPKSPADCLQFSLAIKRPYHIVAIPRSALKTTKGKLPKFSLEVKDVEIECESEEIYE